jgi:uncharacterized DUF497 family protein
MKIIWDDKKNKKLIAERGLSFEEFAALILEGKYAAILKNPARQNQKIFIIPYQEYIYVVPFVTVFPSRKYYKLYGNKNEKT